MFGSAEFFYQSTLRHLLVKGEAQPYVDVLHGAGILEPGIKFYPLTVAGENKGGNHSNIDLVSHYFSHLRSEFVKLHAVGLHQLRPHKR